MKITKITGLLTVAALLLCSAMNAQAKESEYSFVAHNSTKDTIKEILVSEDGKTWGNFDIGRGIPGGQSATLVWDQSTNNEDCKQHVKAVFSDGSESTPAIFDFCEAGLELEF